MSKPQILHLIQFYRDALPVTAKRANRSKQHPPHASHDALTHVKWMLGQPDSFWEPSEKAQRWLGFIQGVLWDQGVYTVDELRAQIDRAMTLKRRCARCNDAKVILTPEPESIRPIPCPDCQWF